MARQQTKNPGAPTDTGQPLAPYRAKRDFKVTAEPKGARQPQAPVSPELPFVVQKHAATRLHYDFRLGWDGVLKSWAVTKGPSYYPGDKRLAVQVEDHPWEYKDFEGTIPKGEYGGGTVMVWDQGTWEPHGDVDRGLAEGHLKFSLHGTRLKGDWVLVRMKGRANDHKTNWLLIKEHDRFERPGDSKPITETAVESAVTKRTLEQIAKQGQIAKQDQIAKAANNGNGSAPEPSAAKTKANPGTSQPAKLKAILQRAPREKLPAFIAPQLAQTGSRPPEGDDWVHELKFDGYRIQIHITSTTARKRQVKLLTRNHLDWSSRMPQIAAAAAHLPVTDAILDGEVVVLNDKGVADFADLQAAFQEGKKKPLTYIAFDLLHLDGHNSRGLAFLDRKALLADLLKRGGESDLHFSEQLEGRGGETFAAACRLGAEGIVSKLASAKYTSGRGNTWLKAKCIQEQEFVIGGFTPVAQSGLGIGALLLGYYDAGDLRYAGRTGTGFSQRTQKLLRQRLETLIRKKPPFEDPPRGALRDVRWVDPVLVAQVSFSNWTRDNLVRQAAFKGLREDKPAREVVRETTTEAPALVANTAVSKPKPESPRAKRTLEGVNMAGLTLTHPDKVLDETSGMTKQDLASYYAAVAENMLPFIADRPLSIVRCPEGSGKPCFFQKHVGFGIPKSVKTVLVPNRKNKTSESYLTVDSAEGLVGLAQMGVLEIHSWGSRNESLDTPDRIVIDLDPDESIDWKTLRASAQEVRKQFKAFGLESFVKSTGGKGLHVVLPIKADQPWSVVKDFAHTLVLRMEKANPDLYVTKMTKVLRKNRIYLDYLRNDREATAIAPFSPRARPGAPVAMPLAWAELKSAARPVFHVSDFAKWRKRFSRDPWAAMHSLHQSLPDEALSTSSALRRA